MLWLLLACGVREDSDETDVVETDLPLPETCDPVDVRCVDAMILDLSLQDDKISDGLVSDVRDGSDFVTTVDARAGGAAGAAQSPWVYVKLTDAGAVRVDLDDVTALTSMDWDIAAKRYVIRLNGGSSGPSCVSAAAQTVAWNEIVPGVGAFATDTFYDAECTIIEDGSGLPGSPSTALGAWWGYNGCVTTTGTPFLVRLADGREAKLRVDAYYGAGQDECNASGAMGTDSALYTWRWSWL